MIFTGLSTSQYGKRHPLQNSLCSAPIGALLCFVITLLPTTLNAAEIAKPGVERSLIGSPLSPAFGLPQIPIYEEEEDIEPVLPPPQPLGNPQQLSNNPSFHLSRIQFTGNNSVDPAKIHQLAQPYEGRTILLSELHQLRHQISDFYLKSGYINSGALIPDQQIKDGVVEIRIIEGGLTDIRLQGHDALSEDYITSRIELDTAPPLNLVKLSNRLQLLQRHSVIKSLKTELKPGLKPGESTLNVLVDENRPYQFQFALSNNHSPSVGSYTLDGQWIHHSLTGHGDSLNLSASWSKGLKGYGINYSLPVSARDTQLNMSYSKDSTVVVEAPFQDLDIEGDSWTGALSLTHPFIKTSRSNLSATLGITVQSSSTTLLGHPFDFSSGSENGKSKSSSIHFSQDWISRSSNQVIAVRSTFKKGIDLFDSTIHQDRPDSRFLSWLGQLQWAHRIGDKGQQLILRTELQLSNDELLTMDKYALGGIDSVRGYRTNQLVHDNAVLFSLEYRLPIQTGDNNENRLQASLFADYGKGWNEVQSNTNKASIYSLGAGLIWSPHKSFRSELFFGYSLNEIHNQEESLQDKGIYFNLVYTPI